MYLLLLCLLAIGSATTIDLRAQFSPHRVTFIDKGPDAFVPGSPLYESTLATFHPKSLQRRTNIGKSPLLDSLDRPIHAPYLSELRALGIDPICEIRWRNCILADIDTLTASQLRKLPFIASVTSTSLVAYPLTINDCSAPSYGESADMHQLINTFPLHDVGVYGKGATIALIDNGFRWQKMTSLQHVDIVGTYDVIYNDSIVSNEPGDPGNQDGHGSLVLSVVAGWQQDQLIGVAPHAAYLLAKSEDMRYERRIEEDLYCAAVEWAERNGADVISSSLGYYEFDRTEQPMDYAWLDGKTAFCTKAVNDAVARGVICVTAAGNSGPSDSTIILPADADSVITVGASLRSRLSWPQSSTGPTADGRTKPDLGVLGAGVRAQGPEDVLISASGTSMATPQVAGIAGLLRELYPEVPTWRIRSALYSSCTRRDPEDTTLGRGVPDVANAARDLGDTEGPGIGPASILEVSGTKRVMAGIFSNAPIAATLVIKGSVTTLSMQKVSGDWYSVDVPWSEFTSDTIEARITASANGFDRSYPSDSTWFTISRAHSSIACGARLPGTITTINEPPTTNYPTTNHPTSNTIFLVQTSTGAILFEGPVDEIPRASLSAGHYLIVSQTGAGPRVRPLVIY